MLIHPHVDNFGRPLKWGDIVVTIDSYQSRADFTLGIVCGSTPQKVKVGVVWGDHEHFIISARRPDKISLINVDDFVDIEAIEKVKRMRYLWEFTGRSLRDKE